MSTQHTPGPWQVEEWDYSHATPPRKELNIQSDKLLIATLAWDEGKDNPYTVPNEQARANARLMAAAPELLAELKARVSDACCPKHYTLGEWRSKNAPAHILITRIESGGEA